MTLRKTTLCFLFLAAAATALSACGRRSSLDTPTQASAREASKAQVGQAEADQAEAARPPQQDRPFILDALIE